ncbi:hypothetical protein COS55_03045 [Candidatus Shapirobacteria bacterium CG03_land_8_20_14_0_80_40_19]|uniref:Uncharacterized protein n=2 Tax=Candidatus Shapironibacteriota TaxID=1752721 RepID=A0A2M7BCB9_9BACT|nr:MAG: hypothetical protein COS55_03045 [Candidatus Shapirobacteria bacterium CG03_land_8_20_14_0_80_40_19]PJC28910.1 MAG: hypothetical protein CO053_02100 [Candidatus Shapirobacteria bacterium CG_4_9_14_0_2_um_filter_40_11]
MTKNNGQSLIEVLAALAIVALVILGIVKATTVSVKNANYSQGQTKAVSLAQEKITDVIVLKNAGPQSFFASPPTPTQELVEGGEYCIKTVVSSDGQTATIEVYVYWGENGVGSDCSGKQYFHNYHVETNVTN